MDLAFRSATALAADPFSASQRAADCLETPLQRPTQQRDAVQNLSIRAEAHLRARAGLAAQPAVTDAIPPVPLLCEKRPVTFLFSPDRDWLIRGVKCLAPPLFHQSANRRR